MGALLLTMAFAVPLTPETVRRATLERNTNETKIKVSLALDVHPEYAPQRIHVQTGIGFLDHVRGAPRGGRR